ncbi:MAG: Ig-like domain-containing protein, partial [Lachnospiraceae bacterium]|nr:Ig-like domain-containing protein [Lachnospiraceae bacterium]
VTRTWKKGEGVEIDAPSDAGQYTLEVGYEADNYTKADLVKLHVVIDPVDIIVVPELSDADKKVADGDVVNDILKKVTYKVYEVVDGKKSESAMTVDEYFWGEYENPDYGSQQYYQPRAIVQVGTKNGDNVDWTSLTDDDKISSDETKQYRVVFNGDLVVYNKDGQYIVNKTDKVQLNYRADLTDAVKDANSVALTVASATEVTIDVSDILKDKKGDSYDNAIISTYNGDGIYSSKADYKKAKLVDKDGKAVASDKEKDFTYQWQRIKEYDADNKEVTPDIVWEDLSDVEVKSAPCNAGNYRLEITYTHTDDKGTVDNTYRAKEKAYVYYTILPQDAIVEVTGAPAAYADGVTTIDEYYTQARLDNNIGIKLYAYDKATKTAGSEIALDVEEQADLRDRLTVWVKVEEEGEHKGEFVQCGYWDKFEAGREYVLTVSDEVYDGAGGQTINGNWKPIYNYNLGRDLDKHGIQQSNNMLWTNADKGSKIEVKASQGVEVSISIDTTQIKNKSQEYNGKAFDLSEIKSLVKITNVKTGEDLTAALKDKLTYQFENTDPSIKVYDKYDDSEAYRVADKEIVKDGDVIHGGNYDLVIKMDATDVYAAASNQDVNITITPKELVVTPKVKDEVKAGLSIVEIERFTSTGSNKDTDNIIADIPDVPDGYIGDDAEGVLGYLLGIYSDKAGDSLTSDSVLKSGKTYYAEYTYVGLKHTDTTENGYYDASKPITYFDRDYSPRSERVAFTPVRAEASVQDVTVETIDNISGTAKDGYVHTITAKTAIPYDKTGWDCNGDDKIEAKEKGNLFTVTINAPDEFSNDSTPAGAVDAVFAKAVKAAGGYTTDAEGNTKTITITFNAEAKDVKEFDIVWKPGYKETFKVDFTNAKLEANFTQSVAPKSLAFNAVYKNMAVGGTQQLDVKITKKQMSDVILLRYASSDESVLKVSDSGYVTALKNGTATISVFPCYQDKEGKIVRIEGAKAATVKIKVAEVAKPKIKKVSVRGTQADVLYAEPTNGYRREIYVLEGKNLKEAAFESAISAVKNGDYSDFAYVSLDAVEDFDNKTVTTVVENLKPNTEYTVYVRNVSGLRTLENGATVAVSAAGAVKSFKTTTQENIGLNVYFDLDSTKVYCDDTDDRCNAKGHDKFGGHKYMINLADKKAKLSVDAAYAQNLSYSDAGDFIWRTLPLSKDDQQKYLSPKLEYYVFNIDYVYPLYDDFIDDLKAGRISQSKLATVDKNGNVTVKGAGTVYVYAVDRVAGECSTVELNIVAEPNSVKGKNAKLTVGQSIWLSELLTYKEGKNTIEGYQNTDWVDLSIDQQSNEYFKIEKYDHEGWNGDSYTTDYKITPIKAGSKLVINVTDKTVAKNGGAPAKVTITSKDIAAVQGLKVANVTDTDFGIFFTDKADSGVAGYKVEVKDERGNILYSEIKSRPSISYYSNKPVREVNGKKYTDKQWFEMDASNTWSSGYQDVKANKNTYYYHISHISDTSINLLSKYTVSVTALYGDDNGYVESKTVSKAVKTTNIPASKNNLLPGQTGGAYIYINTKDKDASSNFYRLNDINALVSGNKYTLTYSTGNTANVRKTDTLTWKSTDTKVATVKANAGSYSATLKAVKPGKTTIEVTSKITKKVIARYDVYVAASGDAHQYFGDNEPYNWSEFAQLFSLNDAINDGSIIEVIAGAPKRVKIDAMTRQWFMFEAPEYADYTFSAGFNAVCADKKTAFTSGDHLDKGDVIYLSYDNNNANDITVLLTISASNLKQEVKVGENAVIAGKNYIFVAPTANCYTFKWLDKNGEELSSSVKTLSVNGKFSLTAPANAVKLVISIPATEEIVKAGEEKTIKFEKLDGVWNTYKFVAPADGLYKFAKPAISEAGADVAMQLLDSLDEITVGTGESVKTDSLVNNGASVTTESVKELRKGEVKYIAIKATSMPTDATKKSFDCKLSIGQATAVEIGKDATVPVKKSDTTTYEYASIVIPESGDYKITVTTSADTNGISSVTVDSGFAMKGSDTKTKVFEKNDLKKNQIVKISFASITTDDVTYTIKAEKLIADKIKVGDTDVAVAANANKTVELPVTETGIYTISAKGSENTITTGDLGTQYFEAGTNAKIIINHSKTETVKVTVKKETINPLASGDVTLSKDGETKYFKFTADKEGVYTISIPTEAGKTTAYRADKLADIVSSNTPWGDVNRYMPAGKTIYVKMTSNSGLAENAPVKVTVSGGVADVATLDKDITVDKSSTKVVSFVAPKKARYEVTTGGMTVTKGYGLDNTDLYIGYANSVVLEAGQKIYFKAVNSDAENSKSFKISEVTTKKADGKDTASLKNGEGAWFEITAGT